MFHSSKAKAPLVHSTVPWTSAVKYRLFSDPSFDWALILRLSMVLVILLIWFSFGVYNSVSDAMDQIPANSVPLKPIDTTVLTQTVNSLNNLSAEHTQILGGYSGPRDPSI